MSKRIRRAEISDAAAIREIYAPYVEDLATSFEVDVPDVAEIESRIEIGRERYPWLVFEQDGKTLGYAYATTHRTRHAYQWSVEASVYVHGDVHRCGVGRALYTALFELLRRQGYVNVYAGITLPNPASERLHESLGFTRVGVFDRVGFKFERWHDVLWLQLRLSDDPRPLHDPLPAPAVWADASVSRLLEACAESIRGQ